MHSNKDFHHQNIRPSINELWVLLVFYLKLKCLNICINIYMHAQSLGLSIVPQCHCIWRASYSSPYNAAQTVCQHILYMLRLYVISRINHKKDFAYKVMKVSALQPRMSQLTFHLSFSISADCQVDCKTTQSSQQQTCRRRIKVYDKKSIINRRQLLVQLACAFREGKKSLHSCCSMFLHQKIVMGKPGNRPAWTRLYLCIPLVVAAAASTCRTLTAALKSTTLIYIH